MNKYKLFAGIAVIGFLCTCFGAWAKILHLSFANIFLTVGMYSTGIALSALAWFAFSWLEKKNKDPEMDIDASKKKR